MPTTIDFDVSADVPLDGPQHIAGWVFTPDHVSERAPVLFCLPGGTYTKAYWHLEVPGYPGYSFAEHFAANGLLVVAIDHLGTGESTPCRAAVALTPEVVAQANAAALSQVIERVREGRLCRGLEPLEPGPIVGVGHSMGAMLAVFQQSLHGSFDAVAALGYGTVGPILTFSPDVTGGTVSLPSRESIFGMARNGLLDDLALTDRSAPELRHHFYWDDVPAEVIAADDKTNTTIPGVTGLLSIVPFVASDHAGRVSCPVFIGLGQRDSTSNHHAEPAGYRSSSDVTLFVLPGSAHCHNMAGTRHQLWDRLVRWISTLDHDHAA